MSSKDEKNVDIRDGISYLNNELLSEIGMEMYSKLVVSWSGIVDENGKEEEFNTDKILEIMQDVSIATQIVEFVNKMGNVSKKLEKDL